MITFCFLLFAVLAGDIEAILYARFGAETFSRNEHADYTLQRLVVALTALAGAVTVYLWHSPVQLTCELVAAALIFPFVHDEVYNFCRLWIKARSIYANIYGEQHREISAKDKAYADWRSFHFAWQEFRFGYQSPTTTAVHDFSGPVRLRLALLGLAVFLGGWASVIF